MTMLRDRAQGRWKSLLGTFGVDHRHLTGKHGPCPICRQGRDRFRFDDRDGRGTWICSTCGAGDGFALLMKIKGWDFKEVADNVEQHVGKATREVEKRKDRSEKSLKDAMNRLWMSGTDISFDDPVHRYLSARGLKLETWPRSLRTVKKCFYRDDSGKSEHPAMIAKVCGQDGMPITIHRTYLTNHGSKANMEDPRRLMPGKIDKGCAVRLAEAGEELGIAEGIETALAAAQLFDVPCWAAVNSGMLMAWEPPAGVRKIIIFADNDKNFAGQAAAYALAHRLAMRGFDVEVRVPEDADTDWNDVLKDQLRNAA